MIQSLGIVTQGTEQPVSGLSGGNQQKVVMARALASDPRLLVLIDPTAGVDVKSKQALLGTVETSRQQDKAVIISSSEIEDLRICDRVLVMLHGRIVAQFAAGWAEAVLIAAMEGLRTE
jgi:simple sugar transport system ATP-binding protein